MCDSGLLSGSIDGWQQLNIGSGFCALSARAIRESRLSESIVEESQLERVASARSAVCPIIRSPLAR